jgi:hypothetical protein
MALKIQQWQLELVKSVIKQEKWKVRLTSMTWLAVPSTMVLTPSLISTIEPVLPLFFPSVTQTWSPTRNCHSRSSKLTSTRVNSNLTMADRLSLSISYIEHDVFTKAPSKICTQFSVHHNLLDLLWKAFFTTW